MKDQRPIQAKLRQRMPLFCSALLAAVLFVVDVAAAPEIASGVPYIGVVMVTLASSRRRDTVYAALLVTVLNFAGYWATPAELVTSATVANRLLALLVIWSAAMLGLYRNYALRSRERLLRDQMAVLARLMHSKIVGKGELNAALREITSAAAATLHTELASVWLFNESRTKLCCIARYQASTGELTSGLELAADQFPHYFRAVRQERTIAAHDARRDPRTREFAQGYLEQYGISSMLDAALWLEGRLAGIVCHEHIGPPRQWSIEEQNFAGSIADFAGLAIEASERRRAEQLQADRNQILERLATGASLSEVLQMLVEVAARHQPRASVALQLLDRSTQHLQPIASARLPAALDGILHKVALQSNVGCAARAAQQGVRHGVPRLADSPSFAPYQAELAAAELQSCWAEPIRGPSQEVLGTLTWYLPTAGEPSAADWELIRSTAHLAGIAIQRKQAEEALQRAHDELEARVAQRTAELQRSNQELQQFAYVASHDLQEPLRAVSGYCQLLQQRYAGQLDQDADEFLTYAVEGAQRMQRLVHALLEYSRIGQSDQPLECIDSRSAVDEALANLRTALEESEAEVVCTDLPEVAAERSQLTLVFQNLISNSLKYRSAAPPQIRIAAAPHDGYWRFTVCDNGIGIAPKHRQQIFNIFQRLHSRDEYPGTGIGLAICKKIIESRGGHIWVTTEDCPGSAFHFTWPRAASTAPLCEAERLSEANVAD